MNNEDLRPNLSFKKHFIDEIAFEAMLRDDYPAFLKQREKLLKAEIKKTINNS